jgi:hypothetical protein
MSNEKRLIDANDLWQKTFVCDEVAEVRKFIEQAPTVDAVEVVRCKECKQFAPFVEPYSKAGQCRKMVGVIAENDFCSYGERRSE